MPRVLMFRRFVLAIAVLLVAGVVFFFTGLAGVVDRSLNKVTTSGPYRAAAWTDSLLDSVGVVDLHADALLWPRDLLVRHDHGHVDLPRLREGRVVLQVFSVVTKTPRGINYERNSDATDNITLLAMAERYPVRAWRSLLERARWQAERLHDAATRSIEAPGATPLVIVRSKADLARLRSLLRSTHTVGGILATEGLHPLESRLENVDTLVASGFRIFGLTHFFDNEVGGSAHGERKGGLTPFGRQVVQRLDSLGMIIDVAHGSPKLFDDVLALSRRPVIVSHGGVQGTCKGPRNLTDDQLRRLGEKGGVIGVGYWDGAICEPTPEAFARAVAYAIRVAGEDHVALGSDFDGSTTTPFDATGMGRVVASLRSAGLSDAQVAKVISGNALRLLDSLLPER